MTKIPYRRWPLDLNESADRVVLLMERLQWDRAQLAAHLGYTTDTIRSWETGICFPNYRASRILLNLEDSHALRP